MTIIPLTQPAERNEEVVLDEVSDIKKLVSGVAEKIAVDATPGPPTEAGTGPDAHWDQERGLAEGAAKTIPSTQNAELDGEVILDEVLGLKTHTSDLPDTTEVDIVSMPSVESSRGDDGERGSERDEAEIAPEPAVTAEPVLSGLSTVEDDALRPRSGAPPQKAAHMTDRILEWMSYRRSGKIGDLPANLIGAANERRFIDDAVTLGHAEWTAPNVWRIAPPVLAGLRRDGEFAAVLCGARTPKLLDGLAAACSATGARLSAEYRPDRPAKVTVAASSQELLADSAVRARISLKDDSAFRILACTPSVQEWPRTPCPMVQGRVETVRRFSRSKMHWVTSTLAEAAGAKAGFFRIRRDWDWVSLIKSSTQDAALILAVVASSCVGLVIDSAAFLLLAFGALDFLAGQVVGKLWTVLAAVLAAVPLIYAGRRMLPAAA